MLTFSKVLVADGAWGTELFKLGLARGASTEEWNLSHPQEVRKLAESYIEAGSDIILTNTFGANRYQLESHGLAEKVKEINKTGAAISVEAGKGKSIIAGDIGPSGKLFFMGDVSKDELFEAFSEQAAALKDGGVQWLIVETMMDVAEMEVAVRAAVSTGLPVVASMTYEKNNAGYRTIMGHSVEEAVSTAEKAGASLIGANCGGGINSYVELAGILKSRTKLPIWLKANAGLPEFEKGKPVYRMTSDEYASYVKPVLEAGVSVIGGCCGTNPEYIKKIRSVVDKWNAEH